MTNELEKLNSLIDIYKIDDESTLEDLLKITGNIKNKWNKKALQDDNKFLSEQEQIEQPETPVNQ